MTKNNNIVERLKEQLPINRILGHYLLGRNDIKWTFKYKCPFHWDWNEKTPSLYASDDKNFFHCFWCKKSGDLITFVREHDKNHELWFIEAIEEIIDTFQWEIWDISMSDLKLSGFNDKEYKYKKLIYEFHEEMNDIMIQRLFENKSKNLLKYLTNDRQLSLDTIKLCSIWLSNWREIEDILNKKLKETKYKEIQKKDTGFYTTNNDKKIPYFLFADRIMFPIRNKWKKIVWWSGWRIFDEQEPKYINSINNFIYDKSVNLFNIDNVKFWNTDTLLVCEWNLDSTQLYNYWADNAVSLLWTNLTNTQISLFKNKVRKVILLLDNDEAGWKAMFKIAWMLLKEWIIPYMVNTRPQKDIDDFLKNNISLKWNIWEYLEQNKIDILSEFMIKNYVLNKDKYSLDIRYDILTKIRDTYKLIDDDIIRIIYKDELKKYDIEFENLEKEYSKMKEKNLKILKNTDNINKKTLIEEKWNSDKILAYTIYLLTHNMLTEDGLMSRNFDLYMMVIANEDYIKYKKEPNNYKSNNKSYDIEFELIWKEKEKAIFNY